MTKQYVLLFILLAAVLVLAACGTAAQSQSAAVDPDPWAFLPKHPIHTDHSSIVQGPFETPQDVTRECLRCHTESAGQVMHTTHWTWESEPFDVAGRDEPVTVGKKNQINNFCISSRGNERLCMTCHAGYGWSDENFDFSESANVDCLACHADAAIYNKGEYGLPGETVDLLAAAQSVTSPTREQCGKCHFDGGGGNGVKHGDLDESLYFPSENLDVHMGRFDMICTDCHQTTDHVIKGKLLADNLDIDPAKQVACQDCHQGTVHEDERIDQHTASVACQTCHIPAMALKDPTKTFWDWSTAGQDLPEDHYTFLKIKGTFEYATDVVPTYQWFNGNVAERYLLGDTIDPTQTTALVVPAGSIDDPSAKIFPFKIHTAKQPYDTINNILIPPRTAGEGGFWETFDWASALELGAQDSGLDYSGEFGFAETTMAYPTTHMVQAKEKALQCTDCHGDSATTRLDWEALGYPGDPMKWGGRAATTQATAGAPAQP